jgi:Ca-activated chloride channel family protein
MMFTFQWPLLALLLPLPFLVSWFARGRETSAGVPEVLFPHVNELRSAFGSFAGAGPAATRFLRWALFLVWTLFVVALMRPQILDRLTAVKNSGHDLMLAVDLSGSMQSLDFASAGERVNRLDVAKSVVKDFVSKRVGDRVGLVLFGEHAYLQTPLTQDTAAVSKMLDNAMPGMAGDSTAIGDALGLAVKNLRERPANSRAIVLLTDGDDNASTLPPLQAAELARQYGIRIYTVVIGKEGVVPFPDENGNVVMVQSQVDVTLTRKVAELTGGEFYRATDRAGLARIYDRIDELQKTESESRVTVIRQPLYRYPLGCALALLAALAAASQWKGSQDESFAL